MFLKVAKFNLLYKKMSISLIISHRHSRIIYQLVNKIIKLSFKIVLHLKYFPFRIRLSFQFINT